MKFIPLHYDMLLAQMLRSPGILQQATEKLDATYFPNPLIGGSVYQGFMFHLLAEYFKQFKTAPDQAAMVINYQTLAGQQFPFPDSHESRSAFTWLQNFIELIKVVDTRSEELARTIIAHIHRICVYEVQAYQLVSGAQESNSYDGIGEQLKLLEDQHKNVQGRASTMANYDLSQLGEDESLNRVASGCSFVDRLLGGGLGPLGPGVIGILGGQTCGKTTLGIQMAVQQAMRGKHAVLMLAENGLADIGIKRNITACATGIPTTLLEKFKGVLKLAAKEAQLDYDVVMQRNKALGDYVHIVDIAADDRDHMALGTELDHLAQQGIIPTVSYIDWAGIIAERLLAKPGSRFKDKNHALQAMSYDIVGIADRFKTLIYTSQQMSATAYQKGPFHHNDHYCAADCKMFTAPFKYVMVLNPRDDRTLLQRFSIPKTRSDVQGATVIRHTREFACFVEADGWAEQGKRFVRASALKDSGFKVPAESH